MARNTQLRSQARYSGGRQYAQDSGGSFESSSKEGKSKSSYVDSRGNLKLSMKQIVIFWSGSVIIMVLAFYLGFVAGKKEGAISVLDKAGDQMVRLELHTPLEPYPRAQDINTDIQVPPVIAPQPVAGTRSLQKDQDNKGSKIDFTTTASLPSKVVEEKVKEKATGIEKLLLESKNVNNPQPVLEEEVYPGKNVFGPPKQKIKETKEELTDLDKKELEQLEKKTQPVTIKSLVPTKGWYVQVAAAPSEEEAMKYYQKISSKGLQAKLEPAAIKDRSFFRILIGPFPSQSAAVDKRGDLKQKAGVTGEPFIRQVQ